MNVPRRHHWLPQFWMRRFRDEEGSFWLCDRSGQISRGSPRSTAMAPWFYAPLVGDDPTDPEVELRLGREVEGPGAEAMSEFLRGHFSEEIRKRISCLLGFQILRVPKYRDVVLTRMRKAADAQEEWMREQPEAGLAWLRSAFDEAGVDADPRQVLQEIMNGQRQIPLTNGMFTDALFDEADAVAAEINGLAWILCHASGSDFVCNDLGFGLRPFVGAELPMAVSGVSESLHSWFVLTPEVCLLLEDPKESQAFRCQCVGEEFVRQTNRTTAACAMDVIIGKGKSSLEPVCEVMKRNSVWDYGLEKSDLLSGIWA